MGSRLTCDPGCADAGDRCTAGFNPRWEAASRATFDLIRVRWDLRRVSIPDGKPPHVRLTHITWYPRQSWLFQSQMGSRLTCDNPKTTNLSRKTNVSIPDGKPPHVRRNKHHDLTRDVVVSIPDGKPPHVRLINSSLSKMRLRRFNPRWEAASRATQAAKRARPVA